MASDPSAAARRPGRLAVVGAGWAGLAAAVSAVEAGCEVTLFEMAHAPGGRARTLGQDGARFDNGQHILIGAYHSTLALMQRIGVDPAEAFDRRPLALQRPDGRGLTLPAGAPLPALLRGLLAAHHWRWADRLAFVRTAWAWRRAGFRCPPDLTVAQLASSVPRPIYRDLIEPLCVAALNTPAAAASASVFLRVLKDALFSGPGAADLLLPRLPLSALLPGPAARWLEAHGGLMHTGRRVRQLDAAAGQWEVEGQRFDAVVLACPAAEAARLAEPHAPAWSAVARAMVQLPIATVWLEAPGLRLPLPMLTLPAEVPGPAQFVFDLAQLDQPECGFAFVCSGLDLKADDDLAAVTRAVVAQARQAMPGAFRQADGVLHAAIERRATFACTPVLQRPPALLAPGLAAAGDYIAGPYPATLEGAVRAGEAAVRLLVGGSADRPDA